MQQQVSIITLGVRDLNRSRFFYTDGFGWTPVFDDDQVVLYQMNGFVLSIWITRELEKDMQQTDLVTHGAFSLAHNVLSAHEVDRVINQLAAAGGRILRRGDAPPHGGYRGYVADPDGHAWEIVWNPNWVIDDKGHVIFGP
jgi:uncharacterized protein